MRTTHMGHPRSPNSRGAQPASVNAGTILTAHDLIVGLASKDREVIERYEALDISSQVIVAKAALAWMRQMSEATAEELDLKSRTLLTVHRHLRLMEEPPEALKSLRRHLAPVCLDCDRRNRPTWRLRAIRDLRGPIFGPLKIEAPAVVRATPAALSASA